MRCSAIGQMTISDRRLAIASDASVGGTFMDWSLHWLSGATQYYKADQGRITLVSDPLQAANAHQHQKNHPEGSQQLQRLLDISQSHRGLITCYIMNIEPDHAALEMEIDFHPEDMHTWKQICDYQQQDLQRCVDICQQRSVPMVALCLDSELAMYPLFRRVHGGWLERVNPDSDQAWQQAFFDAKDWDQDTWDRREKMALDIRPLEHRSIWPHQKHTHGVLEVSCQRWWFDGEQQIRDIMSWADIAIDQSRVAHWRDIYQKWQHRQLEVMRFIWDLPHIIQSIVQGSSRPLPRLTLIQEAVIQHFLIYQHGLNLRNWQLTHFPSDCQDLHALLEPNTHPVPQLYTHSDVLRTSVDSLRSST